MVSDARLRAHLLTAIYSLRDSNSGWVPVSDMNFGGIEPLTHGRIRAICEHLAEAGLISFKPLPGEPNGNLVGMSKITGHGGDVVEGLATPLVALDFQDENELQSRRDKPTIRAVNGDVARTGDISIAAPVSTTSGVEGRTVRSELLVLRPGLWGISVDLKEAYRRLRLRWGS